MTTLAYRNGVLASDSRITVGDTVITNTKRKVHRLKDGRLLGFAGNVEDGYRMLCALRAGKKVPDDLVDISALQVQTDGSLWWYTGSVWMKQKAEYFAVGTGAAYALGAMDAGASAIEAVRIGIKRDTGSGGRVQCVRLK